MFQRFSHGVWVAGGTAIFIAGCVLDVPDEVLEPSDQSVATDLSNLDSRVADATPRRDRGGLLVDMAGDAMSIDGSAVDGSAVDGGPLDSGGGGACVPALADPALPDQTPGGALWTIGRGCYDDRFFIDVPADQAALPAGYAAALQDELDAAKIQLLDFICPDGDMVCRDPTRPTPASVSAPLQANRSWTVVFDAPVRAAKLCEAVGGLQQMAGLAHQAVAEGPLEGELFVGRECAMRTLDAEQEASRDMQEWHLDTLFQGILPAPSRVPIDVVIVDTGIRQQLVDDFEIRSLGSALDVGGADPMAPLHPHASHMALLVKKMSESAQLYDLRVLDEDGNGAIADLAAALERIHLSDLFEAGPLIVNLSLGWPPELSRPRRITGPNNCEAFEAPVGESVRWALAQLDSRNEAHSTIVLAAAGNRPGRASLNGDLYSSLFSVRTDNGGNMVPAHQPCPNVTIPPSPDWFYPAEWNRRPTCLGDGANIEAPRYTVWAIGATNARDERSRLTIDGPEAPVVAPGEHVYVTYDQSDAPVETMCNAVGDAGPLVLPAAITGSSASTALVAGAVAEVQSLLVDNLVDPLKAADMQHLVHLTGDPVGDGFSRRAWRPDPGGNGTVEIRRLSWCKLFFAVEQSIFNPGSRCSDALACVRPAGGRPAVVDGAVTDDCGDAVRECGDQSPCNPVVWDHIPWRPGYQAAVTCREPEICPVAWTPSAPCEAAGMCPYEGLTEQHSAAPLGPQPGEPTCPDCSFLNDFNLMNGTLYLEINHKFLTGTTVQYPYLVVDWLDNMTWKREYVPVPQAGPWGPGDNVKVENMPTLDPSWFMYKEPELALWSWVTPPNGYPSADVSPIRLELPQ